MYVQPASRQTPVQMAFDVPSLVGGRGGPFRSVDSLRHQPLSLFICFVIGFCLRAGDCVCVWNLGKLHYACV